MNAPTERSLAAQLSTARYLIAMFEAQIEEHDAMGVKRRRRTVRGKDLSARIDGMREGHAKWVGIAADLEARIAADTPADG